MGRNDQNRASEGNVRDGRQPGRRRPTLSGQPMIENGQSPEENHVSRTSSSCSSVNGSPAARTFARSVASSRLRPTTQFLPSLASKIVSSRLYLQRSYTYLLVASFDPNEICGTPVPPPKLTGYTPVLDALQPSIPFILRLFRGDVEFSGSGALRRRISNCAERRERNNLDRFLS